MSLLMISEEDVTELKELKQGVAVCWWTDAEGKRRKLVKKTVATGHPIDQKVVDAFTDEIHILQKLSHHPHIVTIVGVSPLDSGELAYWMEYAGDMNVSTLLSSFSSSQSPSSSKEKRWYIGMQVRVVFV
jgi:serine/threonine protein kinase